MVKKSPSRKSPSRKSPSRKSPSRKSPVRKKTMVITDKKIVYDKELGNTSRTRNLICYWLIFFLAIAMWIWLGTITTEDTVQAEKLIAKDIGYNIEFPYYYLIVAANIFMSLIFLINFAALIMYFNTTIYDKDYLKNSKIIMGMNVLFSIALIIIGSLSVYQYYTIDGWNVSSLFTNIEKAAILASTSYDNLAALSFVQGFVTIIVVIYLYWWHKSNF